MNLTGQNFIGNEKSSTGSATFNAVNPSSGKDLETSFYEATSTEVDQAAQKAEDAFKAYRNKSGEEKAVFLESIANEILALGDDLIHRCMAETGLPEVRITGERGRNNESVKVVCRCFKRRQLAGCPN